MEIDFETRPGTRFHFDDSGARTQPPNRAIERSAQQRARCWVPSSLCSLAPAHCRRSTS